MTDTTEEAPAAPASSQTDELKDAVRNLGRSALQFGLNRAGGGVDRLTGRLTDFAEGKRQDDGEEKAAGPLGQAVAGGMTAAASGESPVGGALKGAFSGVKDKVKEAVTGGGGRKSSAKKFSNIVDSYDIGVPIRVAYNQWTQYNQWSEFMKKMEFAEVKSDGDEGDEGRVEFRAKIFVLHRRWESTIIDMVPDDHIVWQSTGDKGYLNGAVTFSELAPNLTRLSLVIEYHPAGFWENLINIWRSVGSRVRLETKLYIHHVMMSTQLDPEAVQGWRAEIHDKKIVRTHDEVVEQERQEQEERERQEQEDREREEQEGEEQPLDQEGEEQPLDQEGEEEPQDEEYEEEPQDEEYDEDEDREDSDEEPYDDEGEYDEDEERREGTPDFDEEPYDEDEEPYDEEEAEPDEKAPAPAGRGRNGGGGR